MTYILILKYFQQKIKQEKLTCSLIAHKITHFSRFFIINGAKKILKDDFSQHSSPITPLSQKKITSFFPSMKHQKHQKHVKHLKHHNTHGPKNSMNSGTKIVLPERRRHPQSSKLRVLGIRIVLVGEFAGEFYSYESDFIFGVFCT